MSNRVIGGVSLSGYKLSKKTADLVRKMEEAEARALAYRRENAEYAKRSHMQPTRGSAERVFTKPVALAKAERELAQLDREAVEKGEPLPDRDAFLAPVHAKIQEYARMEPALTKAAEDARLAAEAAVMAELPALASQALEKSRKARADYEAAYEAMEAAKAALKGSVDSFTNIVTRGQVSTAWIRGLNRNGDTYADCLEFTEDGKLTFAAAWNLHLIGPHRMNVEVIDLESFTELEGERPW